MQNGKAELSDVISHPKASSRPSWEAGCEGISLRWLPGHHWFALCSFHAWQEGRSAFTGSCPPSDYLHLYARSQSSLERWQTQIAATDWIRAHTARPPAEATQRYLAQSKTTTTQWNFSYWKMSLKSSLSYSPASPANPRVNLHQHTQR